MPCHCMDQDHVRHTMRRHKHDGVGAQMTTRSTPPRRRDLLSAARKCFWWMGEERGVGVCVLWMMCVRRLCVCFPPAPTSPLCSKEDDICRGRIGQVTPGAWEVSAATALLRGAAEIRGSRWLGASQPCIFKIRTHSSSFTQLQHVKHPGHS
jgi:hypothetical protein